MDLISKELLIKKIRGYIKAFKPNPAVVRLLDWLINIVDGLPVTQIKTGKWINGRCSECDYPVATDTRIEWLSEIEQHYCYNCGTRMDCSFEEVSNRL